jgi:hypothetical protein
MTVEKVVAETTAMCVVAPALRLIRTIRNRSRLVNSLLQVSGDCGWDRRLMLTDGLLNRRP